VSTLIRALQSQAMDLQGVAREFGGHVAFWGGLDDQASSTRTPQQVRDHVRWTIDTLGRPFGNAYFVRMSNQPPEIPRTISSRCSKRVTTSRSQKPR
jgi:hypothetical protein